MIKQIKIIADDRERLSGIPEIFANYTDGIRHALCEEHAEYGRPEPSCPVQF